MFREIKNKKLCRYVYLQPGLVCDPGDFRFSRDAVRGTRKTNCFLPDWPTIQVILCFSRDLESGTTRDNQQNRGLRFRVRNRRLYDEEGWDCREGTALKPPGPKKQTRLWQVRDASLPDVHSVLHVVRCEALLLLVPGVQEVPIVVVH